MVIVGPDFGVCPARSKVGVGRGGRYDNDASPETHAGAAQARPETPVALPPGCSSLRLEAVFGSGPFEVVGLVDGGGRGFSHGARPVKRSLPHEAHEQAHGKPAFPA